MSRAEEVGPSSGYQAITFEEVKEFAALLNQIMGLGKAAERGYFGLSRGLFQRDRLLEQAVDEGFSTRGLFFCIRTFEASNRPKKTRSTRFSTTQNRTVEMMLWNNEEIQEAKTLLTAVMTQYERLYTRFVAAGWRLHDRQAHSQPGALEQ